MSIRRDKAVADFPDVSTRMLADRSFRAVAKRLAHPCRIRSQPDYRTVSQQHRTVAGMGDRPINALRRESIRGVMGIPTGRAIRREGMKARSRVTAW